MEARSMLTARVLLVTDAMLNQAARGTIDLAALYRRYAPLVLRRVRRFVGPEEAEEVVHEIFLRALEKMDTFRAESSPVTWLYSLTTRHCLNRLRDRGRRRELMNQRANEIPTPQPPAPSTEATLFLDEFWRSLDPELSQIGVHYFVDGMNHDEIARVVGCSPRTVGNRVKRIQKLARKAGTAVASGSKGGDKS